MTINEILYSIYQKTYLVTTDTRSISKGAIFFALKGANFDGNAYALQALEKGAAAVVVDDPTLPKSEQIIQVPNVLVALQSFAKYHREQLTIPVIGLTGSNGKTTTKELIARVLNKKYKTLATQGNLNNHIGVPLTLLSITPEYEMAVVEMGANHQKEIEILCEIAQPNYGYITNFGKAHLEGFGGIEGVIKGKSELYTYLKSNNKIAFINQEDSIQVEKTNNITRYSFGSSADADVVINLVPTKEETVKFSFDNTLCVSQLIGSYNFTNIAAACTIGTYFSIDKTSIIEAVTSYVPTNNRSQIIEKNGKKIILDAYNANPSSMNEAIKNFANYPNPKAVILGDMFELGEYSIEEHQKIVDLLVALQFNEVYLLGADFMKTKTTYQVYKSVSEFIDSVSFATLPNTLLIKGSRGMKLEQIEEKLS